MFNLYQIVTGAQGGQAIDNLAGQFGISREQADDVVKGLIPALSTAFMAKAAQPGGLQEIAGSLTDDQHKQAYAAPETAQNAEVQQKGGDIVSSIFGSSAIIGQVVDQVAKFSGLPSETIRQMLPVVISLVVGGVATAMHNQGLGGILGQLAGGLGGLFGQAGAPAGQAGTGGFGGMFGDILGSVLGGGQHASPQQPAQGVPPEAAPQPAGAPNSGLPPMVQAGIEALGKMFEPGVRPMASHPSDLGDQISSILGGKKS